MAAWVAITWAEVTREGDRLLFLSASTSGKTATFEHVAALDDPKKLGELVSKHRLAKADTIVILNRSDVEVRPMVFPPVPLDELPDLVKFQAGREFNNYDPNAPVDFFVTGKLEDVSRSTLFPAVKSTDAAPMPEGAPKHLLASTLRLATFQKIKSFCDEHNLVLRHIVLRPCATAALWRQSGAVVPNRATLLIELDKNEVSQAVVFQGVPVFMRSPKILRPEDVSVPDFAARLVAELKRTRVAVRNEVQGIDVNEVVICGSGAMFESLAEQLTKGLEMPVRLFDPTKGLTIRAKGASELYAAHFGAIRQIVRRETLQIDFCNPKKRAEDTSKRKLVTAIAAAVLVVIASLFGYAFYTQSALEKENRELRVQFNNLDRDTREVVAQRGQLDDIDNWLSDGVNWFEQLGWLSQHALPSQQMMVRDLTFTTNQQGVSSMVFRALLQDASLVSPMVEGFRDSGNTPDLGARGPEPNPRYTHRADMTIHLSRETNLPPWTTQTVPAEPPPTEPPPVEPPPAEQVTAE